MVAITEQPIWVNEIRQIEPIDPVQGGEGGIDNIPHQQLANRTRYLKKQLDGLTIPSDLSDELQEEARLREEADNELRGNLTEPVNLATLLERIKLLEEANKNSKPYLPVGGIFETTKDYTDGAAVAKDMGYGSWERFGEGKVLVGLSKQANDPAWTKAINSKFGEYEHQLTIDEMPSHSHDISASSGTGGTGSVEQASASGQTIDSSSIGGGQPHNNVQPSVVVGRWRRTA